jgi:nucleoside-diphosphate-sugar epimerase
MVPWTAGILPLPVHGPADLHDLPHPHHVINLHWRVNRALPMTEAIVEEVSAGVHRPAFLWEWLRKHPPASFVNCSTILVFGRSHRGPISAATEPEPSTAYGIAKLTGEKFFTAYWAGLPTAVVHIRLSSVCSYGEHPSHLVSRLLSSALDGVPIQVNAAHAVNLLYIDDAVDVLANAALRDTGGRFIAAPESRRIADIAQMVERLTGKTLNAEFVDLAPGVPDPEFVSDLAALQAPWVRRTPLEVALGRILDERQARGESSGS